MIDNLRVVKPGSVVRIPFNTFDKDTGASITMTDFAVADILVYKDGGTTERASTSGYTATTDFDAKTGKHLLTIDLADNTVAGFFVAGSEYLVAIDQVTVDLQTVGGWVGRFSIGYEGSMLDTFIASLTNQTTFTLNEGPAEDNALNGMWVIIHDAASKVQKSWARILDYTGASKTVLLLAAPTFTIAAGDNVSVMHPNDVNVTLVNGQAPSLNATVDANLVAVNGETGGVAAFARAIRGIGLVTIGSGSTVTSINTSAIVPGASIADQFKGRILTFDKDTTTVALRGQSTIIDGSTLAGVLTVQQLTTAPVSGDTATIQ